MPATTTTLGPLTLIRKLVHSPVKGEHIDGYLGEFELASWAAAGGLKASRAGYTGERDLRAHARLGKAGVRVRFNTASSYGTVGAWRVSLIVSWGAPKGFGGAGYRGGRTAWLGRKLRGGVLHGWNADDWTGSPSWRLRDWSLGWFTSNSNAIPYTG